MKTLVWLSALLLTGCFTFRTELPGTLRALPPKDVVVEVVGPIELEWESPHYIHGLISDPQPLVWRDALLAEAKHRGADGVQDIVIKGTFANIPLTVVTASMVQPRTWHLNATLVRFRPKASNDVTP
jgi:hypothetical protein